MGPGAKLAWLVLAMVATPAAAQDRDLCPNRPGLGTPACTVDKGRVMVETDVADWTRDDNADARVDTVLIGDTLVRMGVSDHIELQLGWTPFGHQRQRDRASGVVDVADRVGDAIFGTKVNWAGADGKGFAGAVQVQVMVPAGRTPIGAGDWGASLVLPLSYELPNGLSLQASPEIDAAVDADGQGRHAAWGGTLGLGFALTDDLSAGVETQLVRDEDPAGHTTRALAGASLAWQRGKDLQLDLGMNLGLNRDSSDVQLYAGVSRRF
jgi:hypothetical protein